MPTWLQHAEVDNAEAIPPLDEETVASLNELRIHWATDPHQPLPKWQAVRKRPWWLAFLHRLVFREP